MFHTTYIDTALLVVRLWFGLEMALAHGWPKMLKILNGDMEFVDPIGIGATASLLLVTLAEFVCSLLLVVGFKTRWAAIPFMIAMLVAAYFHWSTDEVYSWGRIANPLNYFFPALALFLAGPGRYSLDHRLAQNRML